MGLEVRRKVRVRERERERCVSPWDLGGIGKVCEERRKEQTWNPGKCPHFQHRQRKEMNEGDEKQPSEVSREIGECGAQNLT